MEHNNSFITVYSFIASYFMVIEILIWGETFKHKLFRVPTFIKLIYKLRLTIMMVLLFYIYAISL